jgi:putative Holliday junction resolvase
MRLSNDKNMVMAFDFGLSRIGVAIANSLLKIPHPLDIIVAKTNVEKMNKITQLIDTWQPTHLVVGIPSKTDDKVVLINNINKFVNRLKHIFRLDVTLVIEDFSSMNASLLLKEQQIYGMKQKNKLDSLSAMVILENYFHTR